MTEGSREESVAPGATDNPKPEEPRDSAAVAEDVVEGEILEGELEPEPLEPHDLGLELPEDPDGAQHVLLREIATARADASEYLETLQRVAADFENFRKRAMRDQRQLVEHAAQRLVEALLPTLDSFDAAMAFEPQTPTEEKILEGMRGTYQLLIDTLTREGVEIIPAVGQVFDPAVHEAVSGPSGDGEGDLVVSQELRRGYSLGERVIRPALVAVDHG